MHEMEVLLLLLLLPLPPTTLHASDQEMGSPKSFLSPSYSLIPSFSLLKPDRAASEKGRLEEELNKNPFSWRSV